MSRAVIATDRVAAVLLAVVLLVGGVVAVLWWSGSLAALDGPLRLDAASDATTQPWWPWALGALGVALILLGLRWLAAHLPDHGVAQLVLPGSGGGGRLLVDARAVAEAAADALEGSPGVRSAKGVLERDRGQLVARLTATVEREADLESLARAADAVSAQLRTVLGRDDVRGSVQLTVAQRRGSLPRVH